MALHKSHTLEAHFELIGMNLSESVAEFEFMPTLKLYYIKTDNHSIMHDMIRYDPGVLGIENNLVWNADDFRLASLGANETNQKRYLTRVYDSIHWPQRMVTAGKRSEKATSTPWGRGVRISKPKGPNIS